MVCDVNFPVGLVLLWGLKKGDFLAQKGAPKIGQKGAPQSPKPNGKLLVCDMSAQCNKLWSAGAVPVCCLRHEMCSMQ